MHPIRTAVLLGLCGLAAFAACSEQIPASLEREGAGPPPPPWGLDERPASATCKATTAATSTAKYAFERLSPIAFERPTGIVEHEGRLYVLQQGTSSPGGTVNAMVRVLGADPSQAPIAIDISSRTVPAGEMGLLGLAFHPKFAQNHFVYLYYLSPHPQQPPPAGVVIQSVVARYLSSADGLTFDPASEKRLLVVDQPFHNHNGGTIAFGNDGFLYFGLGDGGSGGDPFDAAQNKNNLLGKMLRLDVDGGDPYAIPPSNPFATAGGSPEIYALGFRNPFRFSFDRPTGDLWVGDVGQAKREEIDKVVLGGNYGWNIREGATCFKPATGCDATGLIDPIVEHGRDDAVAITGGVIYHGTAVPDLTDKYVYGDNGTGKFFAFDPKQAKPVPTLLDVGLPLVHPAQFALDAQGEIVFVDVVGGGAYRIALAKPTAEMPAKLGETGCFDKKDPTKPVAGLFPYDVNMPQWLDGNVAERYLSIPAGAQLVVKDDARLELPPGAVALRTVRAKSKPVETQILMRRPDGSWAAYAYAWNAAGTDASLAAGTGCLDCHNAAAGVTLGLEAGQLDRLFNYAVRPGNPLLTLDHLGMLTKPIPKESYSLFPTLDSYDTIERRARAYLHTNCASCHRAADATGLDLRFANMPAKDRLCSVVRTMRATDKTRMPPFSTSVPDTAGISVVEEWIRSLGSCK